MKVHQRESAMFYWPWRAERTRSRSSHGPLIDEAVAEMQRHLFRLRRQVTQPVEATSRSTG